MTVNTTNTRQSSLPDGPRDGVFGFRIAQQIRENTLQTYEDLHRNYGDRSYCRIGPFRLFFFFHPQDVREVLITHAKSIIRDPRPLRVFEQWNGRSVLIAEGEQWIRQRRLVQPAFQSRRFGTYAEKMGIAITGLQSRIADTLSHQPHADIDIDEQMTALTLDIICQTMFSTNLKSRTADVRAAVTTLAEIAFHEMQAPFIWPQWLPTKWNRRKKQAIRVLDQIVREFIRQRRAEQTDKGDLLSMLLNAVDEEGDGGSLTDEQVRNEVMTLMLAGHDTTAAGLDWIWLMLARHPEIAQQCREEIRSVCGDRPAEFSDLPQLSLIDAVIRETLRLYPPTFAVFLRKAIQDVTIGEIHIPKGSLISLSSYVTQHDARWFPDPLKFDPGRFMPPHNQSIPQQAWFPFGAGPRVCIGQSFAMMEMQMIVARLLPHFHVSVTPDRPEPVPHLTASLRPREQLMIRFRRAVVLDRV